jgi:hypothetical protein
MEETKVEQPKELIPVWKEQGGESLVKPSKEEMRKAEIKNKRLAALARARDAKRMADKFPKDQAPAIKVNPGSDSPIIFFTESDIDPVTKKIKNTYPTYFNRKQRDDLEEEIRKMEKGLSNNYYHPGDVPGVKENLKKAKNSLEKIHEHAPVFEKRKDDIYRMTKDLGGVIGDSMFTRSDMMKGLADAHEEARRMSEPVIEVNPVMAGIAVANGMLVSGDRKMTRNDAIRLWQLGRKSLGEMCDAETLRRD